MTTVHFIQSVRHYLQVCKEPAALKSYPTVEPVGFLEGEQQYYEKETSSRKNGGQRGDERGSKAHFRMHVPSEGKARRLQPCQWCRPRAWLLAICRE